MKEPIVVDSTCLIGLERIGQLHLLPELFEPVLAPPEVVREFGASPHWLRVQAPAAQALVDALGMLVDSGEAEAMALARDLGTMIVLDDLRARGVGQRMDLHVLGTLGILIRAKRAGLIKAIRPQVDALEEQGFYIGAALRREALRLAEE